MVFNCLDLLQTKEFLDVFEKAAKLDFAIFSMTGNANNLYQSFISRRSIDERRKNEIIANNIAAFLFEHSFYPRSCFLIVFVSFYTSFAFRFLFLRTKMIINVIPAASTRTHAISIRA